MQIYHPFISIGAVCSGWAIFDGAFEIPLKFECNEHTFHTHLFVFRYMFDYICFTPANDMHHIRMLEILVSVFFAIV